MSGALLDRLLPVRMLNEHVYCPRLFALEWLHDQWADSADTVEGQAVHRRVDQEDARGLPDKPDPNRPVVRRSVDLADEALGLVAKIDLVEGDDAGNLVPVDFKRGKPAPNAEGAWEPERVQVCAQGLLLRAHGYSCDYGVLYFAKARRRVRVDLTDDLIEATLRHRDAALELARAPSALPEPLLDSPKCARCSLVGICLPDEHHRLKNGVGAVRPLVPPRDDGQPLYVQLHGGRIGKRAGEVHVHDRDGLVDRVPLATVSQVVVMGNVTVSTPLIHELAQRDIPVAIHGYGGRFFGMFTPASGQNALMRIAQHQAAAEEARALPLAKGFIDGKTHNQRVLLRRNGVDVPPDALTRLKELRGEAARAPDLDRARGYEGAIARLYFQHFDRMLKGDLAGRFSFEGRNRRPPRDPVNALLSFVYACLVREVTVILHRIGLDPYVGYLHLPRHGRPALALDLMEEFRPLVADSVVVSTINNGVYGPSDFVERVTGVSLTRTGRAKIISAYERRLDELITHPNLGTRLSYRRVIEVQARLLGKVVLGELSSYPAFKVR